MLDVIFIIIPIFITIFIGYLIVNLHLINKDHIKYLGLFVIKVSLPCLLLINISSQNFNTLIQFPYLFSYGVASIIIFLSTLFIYILIFKFPLNQASIMSLGSAMSNTGFIGSGLLYLFLGEKSSIYFGMTFLVESFIIFLMFLICLELSENKSSMIKILRTGFINIIKNPIVISLLLGVILSAFHMGLPEILKKALKPIGQSSAPLGLIVIGGSLSGISIFTQSKLTRDIFIISGHKLILMPFLVYILFKIFPNTTSEMVFSGVLLSSVSMVGLFAIYGQQFNMDEVPIILLITTFLCIFSISFVIHYMYF